MSLEVISECCNIAAKFFADLDWDCLTVESVKADDNIGLTSWDSDGNCVISLSESIANETDLRDVMAHELAHFVMGELFTKEHNARQHGIEWFTIYCMFQREMVWKVYYPEDWK